MIYDFTSHRYLGILNIMCLQWSDFYNSLFHEPILLDNVGLCCQEYHLPMTTLEKIPANRALIMCLAVCNTYWTVKFTERCSNVIPLWSDDKNTLHLWVFIITCTQQHSNSQILSGFVLAPTPHALRLGWAVHWQTTMLGSCLPPQAIRCSSSG